MEEYIYQVPVREWIEKQLDSEIMIPVEGIRKDGKYNICIQSFMLPVDMLETEMENDTYNAGTLMPGITVYDSDEKEYLRWGNDRGYEPIAIRRCYDGLAPDSVEVIEEFRLLFNLYYNSQKNEYVDVCDGDSITVVKMNDNGFVSIL